MINQNPFIPARWLGGVLAGFTAAALAVSPAQVQQMLDAGAKITFVDVRISTLFQKGHLPGAINIPVQLVPQKQLPPLGLVIVYDSGLGESDAATAVTALNQKTGISADLLDGGFAAWETAQSTTTRSAGMKPEEIPMITYAQLAKEQSPDMVLVDLRSPVSTVASSAATSTTVSAKVAAVTSTPLTDLSAEFPNARIASTPFAAGAVAASKAQALVASAPPPLYVLIDNGDGSARNMARALKANGITRFAVLAGGEQILSVHGQAGSQRIGSSVTVRGSTNSVSAH